ncbi:hypothetical protein ACYZT3_15660 [Pseudomonas sp. MDT1-16]
MALNKPLTFDAPKILGVADPDVDPEGHIPIELLLKGIDVVVPLWPEPAKDPGERDILTVSFEQPGEPLVSIQNTYEPDDMKPEFIIHLSPEYLKINDVGALWYEVHNIADNPSNSFPRRLTIDHPGTLEEADFVHATKWGYLNCDTVPPLWDGVTVNIPALAGFNVGDRCEVLWRGFSTLNGSGSEFISAKKTVIRPALSEQDIHEGFSVVIEPYETHIKPMVKNASATVVYTVYRDAKRVGKSKTATVKIDRIEPGEEFPCEPPANMSMEAGKVVRRGHNLLQIVWQSIVNIWRR